MHAIFSQSAIFRGLTVSLFATGALLLTACGGGGGGGGGSMEGDDARRAVLADIANDTILPRIDTFKTDADALATALTAYAAALTPANQLAAEDAWRAAMASASFLEPLQVGPAAMGSEMGGENLRDLIYSWPQRSEGLIRSNTCDGANVVGNRSDDIGLAAIEYVLFSTDVFADTQTNCNSTNETQLRADYARKVADFTALQAAELQDSWAPTGENFLAEWSNAGAGSNVYSSPQEALNALSVALFYVEKQTKDSKIACPTGIGASGLSCTGNDTSRVEHPDARVSLASMRNNVQVFRDAFTGVNGGMGINDLLIGINRQDLADEIVAELDTVLNHLDNRIGPNADGFETAVAAINDANACSNASANPNGGAANPAACSLHGLIKIAMDTFRGPIVASLSLQTPDSAAGDND